MILGGTAALRRLFRVPALVVEFKRLVELEYA
jgi:hypothetical protein